MKKILILILSLSLLVGCTEGNGPGKEPKEVKEESSLPEMVIGETKVDDAAEEITGSFSSEHFTVTLTRGFWKNSLLALEGKVEVSGESEFSENEKILCSYILKKGGETVGTLSPLVQYSSTFKTDSGDLYFQGVYLLPESEEGWGDTFPYSLIPESISMLKGGEDRKAIEKVSREEIHPELTNRWEAFPEKYAMVPNLSFQRDGISAVLSDITLDEILTRARVTVESMPENRTLKLVLSDGEGKEVTLCEERNSVDPEKSGLFIGVGTEGIDEWEKIYGKFIPGTIEENGTVSYEEGGDPILLEMAPITVGEP